MRIGWQVGRLFGWYHKQGRQTDNNTRQTDRRAQNIGAHVGRQAGQKAKKSDRKSRNTDPPPKFQNVFPERTFAWNGGITQKIRIFDKKK